MTLGISNATVGYDVNGMQSLINDVNTKCVVPACTSIRTNAQNVRTVIDAVWVGASAEAFKTKLSEDTDTLCQTLEQVGEDIQGQLNTAGSNVEDYDNALAEQIKNW